MTGCVLYPYVASGVRVSLGNAILGLKFSKPGTLRTLHLSLRFFKNLGLDFASLRILKKKFSKPRVFEKKFAKPKVFEKIFFLHQALLKKFSKPKVFEKKNF